MIEVINSCQPYITVDLLANLALSICMRVNNTVLYSTVVTILEFFIICGLEDKYPLFICP